MASDPLRIFGTCFSKALSSGIVSHSTKNISMSSETAPVLFTLALGTHKTSALFEDWFPR